MSLSCAQLVKRLSNLEVQIDAPPPKKKDPEKHTKGNYCSFSSKFRKFFVISSTKIYTETCNEAKKTDLYLKRLLQRRSRCLQVGDNRLI